MLRVRQPLCRRGRPRGAPTAEQGVQTKPCLSEASSDTTSTPLMPPECPMSTSGPRTSWRAPGPAHTMARSHPNQTCLRDTPAITAALHLGRAQSCLSRTGQFISVPAERRATSSKSILPAPHLEVPDAASPRFSVQPTPPRHADSHGRPISEIAAAQSSGPSGTPSRTSPLVLGYG
ncbi:hypothetical protein NDU88_004848 [Pleurodeles waltl]|uniref:Uncharacterized protein n=1 Tax=Pleurodeles waltl TaxID=8319 RepID=A0AAV7LJC6_PLEWA|nr:hypothetical protein NDU88_004848 [Pleurodeles waltl]